MNKNNITFIGCGNMGSSLIGGLLADGYDRTLITGCETDPERRAQLAESFGIEVYADAESAVTGADIIILAVKPQVIGEVCTQIRSILPDGSLVISIAAGIELESLNHWLGEEQAVVRVMPNTPALIGAGASALIANDRTSSDQKNQAEFILRAVGITLWLEDETLFNAVTAVSGSGPAYFFLVMEAIQKAAVNLGLGSEEASLLTLQTALGAARMALESDADTGRLRQQVTSPGGTTEQALKVLLEAGIEQIFADALKAASDRSAELAEAFGGKQAP